MKIVDRSLSVLVCTAALVALAVPPLLADDAACKAILDAVIKQTGVPVHQKIMIESAAAPGKPIQSEMIHLGDTLYMQVRGQWMARPYNAGKSAEDARQAMQKAEHSCTRVGSEAVAGQAAELYSVQTKSATGATDSRIWISSASGLPVRQQTTMVEQGATRMKHEVSFDYANVAAPADVRRQPAP